MKERDNNEKGDTCSHKKENHVGHKNVGMVIRKQIKSGKNNELVMKKKRWEKRKNY